ncbi:hypothetical protein SAMN04489812_3404 [Microlunatus soli]|uniref:Uncharacterized protein n=1 Tax=Microlunatus soli TaxID=630515 RepID=A0A1H1VYV6_9ACTN|nr:hypothetical protein SAMN04489812_3404 [Microlunatus soli]
MGILSRVLPYRRLHRSWSTPSGEQTRRARCRRGSSDLDQLSGGRQNRATSGDVSGEHPSVAAHSASTMGPCPKPWSPSGLQVGVITCSPSAVRSSGRSRGNAELPVRSRAVARRVRHCPYDRFAGRGPSAPPTSELLRQMINIDLLTSGLEFRTHGGNRRSERCGAFTMLVDSVRPGTPPNRPLPDISGSGQRLALGHSRPMPPPVTPGP